MGRLLVYPPHTDTGCGAVPAGRLDSPVHTLYCVGMAVVYCGAYTVGRGGESGFPPIWSLAMVHISNNT